MQVIFHWIRVQTFCYATERRDLLEETMTELLGTDEFTEDISESEHGNVMTILEARLTKQREFEALFRKLGRDVCEWALGDIENRVDDDCVFYIRLDKQCAVQGEYKVAHHGDVLAITGKVQSHPARKEVAVGNLKDFLTAMINSVQEDASS